MSSVPSPRVRKPKPRARLNHLTMTISNAPTELACARVRAGGSWVGAGRVGLGDRDHPEHLQAAFAPLRLGDDARAFANGGEPVAPQHGHMDENVGLAAVRDDEAVALGDVEPFDPPGDFDEPDRAFIACPRTRAVASDGFTNSSLNSAPTQRVGCTSSPPMNLLRVAIGTIRSAPPRRRRSATQVIRSPR